MIRTALRAAAATAVAAVAVLAGPAGAAWAEETAEETISRLQQQGYQVLLDKLGTGPLSKCVVLSVRSPHTFTQWVPYVGPGLGDFDTFLVPVVTSRTIAVSLDCTRQ
ncbi:MAG: hypothetical protein FGM52_06540 [Mycobacterium sp.]|nr:hypothetical protein [Mycobacterium sp.]